MKKFLFFSLIASIALVTIFTACTKEAIAPNEEGITGNIAVGDRDGSTFNITSEWAQGATTLLGSNVHPAQTNTVTVTNDPATGRVIFYGFTGLIIGRTNGEGNNGVAGHAFAFRAWWNNTGWDANVPFAFGTRPGNREAIWTPVFQTQGISNVHMGLFATDNGAGDEDPTVGIIEVGDFRAIDGDFHESRPNKVIFRKWNGSSWQQIGRTNGAGDDGNLLAFTVVNVRTDYTVSGGKVTAQTPESVPVAKIDRGGGVTRLITDLPGGNIGTAMMYQY